MKKDKFFKKWHAMGYALTYNDVRLKTGYSSVMPSDVSLASKFTRHVPVGIPLASAAMDTVTESRMAIALAMLGGIGVIHRSLSPEEQAAQVKQVKFYLNGLNDHPVTVREDDTIADILSRKAEKEWSFDSFPVVNARGKLVGLLTSKSFRFCKDHKQKARDVMTTELVTRKAGTTGEQAYRKMMRDQLNILPLVESDGRLAGLYAFKDLDRIINDTDTLYNLDKNHRLRVAAAVGVGQDAMTRLALMHRRLDVVVIDTAHADTRSVVDTIKAIKKLYSIEVMVGNVSEGASAKRLIKAGADGIKVGQGPGSICTTRTVAGVGRAQLSAIYDCAQAAKGSGVPICADGGITCSGDIPIAIGAGADSVMMGRILASADEAPGRIIDQNGQRMHIYRGMGSLEAMADSAAARERYSQGDVPAGKRVPEGVPSLVPVQGPLEDIVNLQIGGLRAGMGYVGAADINQMHRKASFDIRTQNGTTEDKPHDVVVISDSSRM